jgi:hypothetical protein
MVAKTLIGLALYAYASILHQATAEQPSSDSTFVGWRGESFDKKAVFGTGRELEGERWIETISWTPRAFIFHNLLSEEEASELIVQAAPQLRRSTVVGSDDSGVVDDIRTSYGTFLGRLSSPAVERLEKRLAEWTQLPIVNQEDIQVWHLCVRDGCEAALECLNCFGFFIWKVLDNFIFVFDLQSSNNSHDRKHTDIMLLSQPCKHRVCVLHSISSYCKLE